jgi:hypothetical protein
MMIAPFSPVLKWPWKLRNYWSRFNQHGLNDLNGLNGLNDLNVFKPELLPVQLGHETFLLNLIEQAHVDELAGIPLSGVD